MTDANFISEMPKELEPYYQESVSEYQKRGVFFLNVDYILSLHEKFRLFPNILSDVLQAASEIEKDENGALYALFVYKCMLEREVFKKFSFLFDFTEKHPFLPLFCIIPTVENTYKHLSERNVPQDIIKNILCHLRSTPLALFILNLKGSEIHLH